MMLVRGGDLEWRISKCLRRIRCAGRAVAGLLRGAAVGASMLTWLFVERDWGINGTEVNTSWVVGVL